MLSGCIDKDKNYSGFIPVMDLIRHDEFYISSRFGLSFDGQVSNSYIYYKNEGGESIDKIRLFGDISSQEAILTGILFRELYDSDVKLEIAKEFHGLGDENYILAGDINFSHSKLLNGFSFAEEMMEITELPYVNYVLASTEKETLEEIHKNLNGAEEFLLEEIDRYKFIAGWEEGMKEYLRANSSSFVYEFDESDLEGIKSQLRIPFYYGIAEDIVEPKFV